MIFMPDEPSHVTEELKPIGSPAFLESELAVS